MSNDLFDVLDPLEPRQQRFVEEYVQDLNGTQAAIRAGYNPRSASVTASELLAKGNISAAVEKLLAQRSSRRSMSADTVLHEMSLLANSRIEWFFIDDNGVVRATPEAPEGATGAIQSVKYRVEIHPPKLDKEGALIKEGYRINHAELRLWDKPGPLKLMGRHIGLFADKVEVSGPGGGPIKSEVTEIKRTIIRPEKKS